MTQKSKWAILFAIFPLDQAVHIFIYWCPVKLFLSLI